VTCISLLLPDRVEAAILEPPHLELEKLEIDLRAAAEVVGLGLQRGLARDTEDRDAPAVRPTDPDAHELAAAQKREPAQEEVIGRQHSPPPRVRLRRLDEEMRAMVGVVEVSSVSPLPRAGVGGPPRHRRRRPAPKTLENDPGPKTCQAKSADFEPFKKLTDNIP
jgi:hypothetical protein